MQTEWFEGTTKPSVDGMYKRKFYTWPSPVRWAKFEDGHWFTANESFEEAQKETEVSDMQDEAYWAGCTETDWISGQILPFHEGVYKRLIVGSGGAWAKFKNGQWYMAYSDYEAAKKSSTPSKQQNLFPWKAIHCE